jgi:hypothetical protein
MSYKVCVSCNKSLPATDYHSAGQKNKKGETYMRASCKVCNLKVKRIRKKSIRGWLRDYKMSLSCEGCGYSKETSKTFSTKALQFHHSEGDKSFEIGNSIGNGYSVENIQKEIDKCMVLCSRCHAELHDK